MLVQLSCAVMRSPCRMQGFMQPYACRRQSPAGIGIQFLSFWQVLQQVIVGCGETFRPHVTPELRDVIFRALLHQNRFVRETCYHILAELCMLCSHEQLLEFSDSIAERLQDGLNENWSQVCNKSQKKPHSPCGSNSIRDLLRHPGCSVRAVLSQQLLQLSDSMGEQLQDGLNRDWRKACVCSHSHPIRHCCLALKRAW